MARRKDGSSAELIAFQAYKIQEEDDLERAKLRAEVIRREAKELYRRQQHREQVRRSREKKRGGSR